MFIKRCEIQDNLNQQNFTSNCTLILNEKKKFKKKFHQKLILTYFRFLYKLEIVAPLQGKNYLCQHAEFIDDSFEKLQK